MGLSLFLARRFFLSQGEEGKRKASSLAIRIATIGIAIGLAVMFVSISIVEGYQKEIREKLTGFVAHIEVMDIHSLESPESYPLVTDKAMAQRIQQVPGVVHVQRYAEKMGILKTENDFSGFVLKGVAQDYDLSFVKSVIIAGKMPDFRDDKPSNEIVISKTLADKLRLKVGDNVYSYYFAQTIKQRKFKVAAIYYTHLKQIDKSFVLTDLYTVRRLNGWQPDQSTGFEVRLSSLDELPLVQTRLNQQIGNEKDHYGRSYAVTGIRENPRTASVMAWLDLLNLNMYVILCIMIGVAGFTMISGLLILILERTTTIGLLKALGAANHTIQRTFLWYAAFIVGRGMLIGNIIGAAIVFVQQRYKLIPLDPEEYHLDSVPMTFKWEWIVGLNLLSAIVMMLALIVPSFLVAKIQPAKSIRFD